MAIAIKIIAIAYTILVVSGITLTNNSIKGFSCLILGFPVKWSLALAAHD